MGILARKVVGVHLAMLDTDYWYVKPLVATRGLVYSAILLVLSDDCLN